YRGRQIGRRRCLDRRRDYRCFGDRGQFHRRRRFRNSRRLGDGLAGVFIRAVTVLDGWLLFGRLFSGLFLSGLGRFGGGALNRFVGLVADGGGGVLGAGSRAGVDRAGSRGGPALGGPAATAAGAFASRRLATGVGRR